MRELDQTKLERLEDLAGKYAKFMKYSSVRAYLEQSINSKSSQIGSSSTLEDKIEDVELTKYLRGLDLFLGSYMSFVEENKKYPTVFETPNHIVDHYYKIRDNPEKVNRFKQLVEDFIIWLRNEARGGKGYASSSAETYQAQFRGFLRHNNFSLNFRNYDSKSKKDQNRSELGIEQKELLDMSERVFDFISKAKNFDLYVFVKWLKTSGLGNLEVRKMKFGLLRTKFQNKGDKKYIRIDGIRKKTGVEYSTFLYGDLKEDLEAYLRENQEKKDDDLLFGNNLTNVYANLRRQFNYAVDQMIEKYYPQYLEHHQEDRIFTFHTFRDIFITESRNKRIPIHIENLFTAHSNSGNDKSYPQKDKLWEYFSEIQQGIYRKQKTSTEQEIEQRIISRLTKVLRSDSFDTKYQQFKYSTQEEQENLNTDMQINLFLHELMEVAMEKILSDPFFLKKIAESNTFMYILKEKLMKELK